MQSAPYDIAENILKRLSIKDSMRVCALNRHWFELYKDPDSLMWKDQMNRLVAFDWPNAKECVYWLLEADDGQFVTKTRAKSELCLSDKDLEEFQVLLRPNPHYRSAAKMQLYIERDIRAYVLLKYGSLYGYENEIRRREQMREKRNATLDRKHQEKIAEQRKRREEYLKEQQEKNKMKQMENKKTAN